MLLILEQGTTIPRVSLNKGFEWRLKGRLSIPIKMALVPVKKYLADLFFRPPFNLGNKSKQLWEKAQPSVLFLPPILYRAINGVEKQERGVISDQFRQRKDLVILPLFL